MIVIQELNRKHVEINHHLEMIINSANTAQLSCPPFMTWNAKLNLICRIFTYFALNSENSGSIFLELNFKFDEIHPSYEI